MRRVLDRLVRGRHLRQGPVWLLRDPVGMVVAGFCWGLMVGAIGAVWASLRAWLGPRSVLGLLEGLALSASVGMCMWSHWMVMTTDPGYISVGDGSSAGPHVDADADSDGDADDDDELIEEMVEMPLTELEDREDDGSLQIFCDHCNVYRPTRATHCDTCGRCIVLLDHHCPWVNNCIGIKNQKFFLLFLGYVTLTSVHVVALVLLQRWTCRAVGQAFCGFGSGEFPGRLGIWLLAAGCTFGLFCLLMLAMELYSIDDDPLYSAIAEHLHDRAGCKSRTRLERHLSVIFGANGIDATWLLPLPHTRSRAEWAIVGGLAGSHPEPMAAV